MIALETFLICFPFAFLVCFFVGIVGEKKDEFVDTLFNVTILAVVASGAIGLWAFLDEHYIPFIKGFFA